MAEPIRAGGHVLRESGWEPEQPPRPARAAVAGELTDTAQEADQQAAQARAEADADADTHEPQATAEGRAECPDCGKEFAVNKDGTLRKHTCVIDAPAPDVTFEEGEADGGSDDPGR